MISDIHYAKNCHGQPNPNASYAKKREGWTDFENACASDVLVKPKGAARSVYGHFMTTVKGKQKKTLTKPWTFAANEFKLNIPCGAYIRKITFKVNMKIQGKTVVKAPYARFNLYHGTKSVSNTIKNDTGWDNGYYYYNPNVNISSSITEVTYVMSGAEFNKRGYPATELNEDRMGIDLRFYDSSFQQKDEDVLIQYVSCQVEYDVPNQLVYFEDAASEGVPRITQAGVPYTVNAVYENRSSAYCCNGTVIQVNAPPNSTVHAISGNYDEQTGEWTVPCNPNDYQKLQLEITDYSIGKSKLNLYNENIGHSDYWIDSKPNPNDLGTIHPYPDKVMQKGVKSCVTFKAKLLSSNDNRVIIPINLANNHTVEGVTWSLVEEETDEEVSIYSGSDTLVVLTVPRNKTVDVTFKGCFIPKFTGLDVVSVSYGDPSPTAPYKVIDSPEFIIRNTAETSETDRDTAEIIINPCVLNIITERVATETEVGAYVIDCGIAEYDNTFTQKQCSLTADYWEMIDYIGCVPLRYHHYDPDSTYSNKAISNAYKNKVYKGKEGEIEEKISLKFKARPKEVPTLQGLTLLDKPTPINANHKCFEGDPLNHRGWVVLSEIKAKRTNPLWYDIDAEVDYITHDIHTKFQISKGGQITDAAMPQLQADVLELGTDLSTALDLFDIDTDGGFIYDEEGEDGAKNIFSLDEGETLSIKTRNALTDASRIRFDWYSNRINELRENLVRRIFRIRNKEGEPVFEYEYTDFVFDDEFVSCTVIDRVLTDVGGWEENVHPNIDLRTELEADPIVDEQEIIIDDVEVIEESDDDEEDTPGVIDDEEISPAYDPTYIAPTFDPEDYDISLVYGSSLTFNFNKNVLTLIDAGFNGSEYSPDPYTLVGSGFTFETVWTNLNADGSTEDVVSYIDIELSESILDTKYKEMYTDLVVSTYPIPNKTVVFTRESEEGTLYYLTGSEPFKFLLEPYYQYQGGCDLLGEGISIFDLNNSYTHYYIENGLVRFGFNKYNGRLYLAKYDTNSEEWITTHYFHMVDEPKFSLELYSDDKMVIKAGNDTYFTIWRGHPFVAIETTSDKIYIDSKFNYCLADKVNGESYEFPVIHSFTNDENLLPSSIGGLNSLDPDVITIDDDTTVIVTDHEVSLSGLDNIAAFDDVTITATVTNSPTGGKVHLLVNGDDVANTEAPFNFPYQFKEPGVYRVQAVYTGDEDDNIAISEEYVIEVQRPSTPQGTYKLEIVSAPSKMTYRDKGEVKLRLTRGGIGVQGAVLELQLPDGTTESVYTKPQGYYTIVNNRTAFVPNANAKWGARFYDPNDVDHDNRVLLEATRKIPISKATPTFTHNDVGGKVNKGKVLVVKLNGVDAIANPKNYGLKDRKIVYTLNGGSKKSKTTSEKGTIHIPFNTVGTYKLKLMFAGSQRYNPLSKPITIKVVK